MHSLSHPSAARRSRNQRSGFTLVELLVTMSILAILFALVATVSPTVMAKVHRTGCATNMKQQLVGFQMWASDNSNKAYWPSKGAGDDNAAYYLYPNYVGNLKAFICPATKHVIREDVKNRLTGVLVDLEDNSHGVDDKSGGCSYEYFAYYSIPAKYLVDRPGDTTPARKRPNHFWREAHDTVLVVDGDDVKTNNYPDPGDNHGDVGWNWGFADGHVEWVTRAGTAAAFKRQGPEPK